MAEVKQALAKQADVKDMGELHYFLGMKGIQSPKTAEVWVSQPAYAESVLQQFVMENAKEINIPVDGSSKLGTATEDCNSFDQGLYQSAVGSLLSLSIATRPDITYAVDNVAKFCAKLTKQHWTAVKRILRYLKGTLNFGLLYSKDGSKDCVG